MQQAKNTGSNHGAPNASVPMLINLGGGMYVSPAVGQMVLSMQVTPLIEDAAIKATIEGGDVRLMLILATGTVLHLDPEQSHNFLIAIGVRRPLVEVAPASLAAQLKN